MNGNGFKNTAASKCFKKCRKMYVYFLWLWSSSVLAEIEKNTEMTLSSWNDMMKVYANQNRILIGLRIISRRSVK